MTNTIELNLPVSEDDIRNLNTGDFVYLNGTIITARDAAHKYLYEDGEPPCDLSNAFFYHCGPVTIKRDGKWKITAAGPTTSIREEPYTYELVKRYGLKGIIGKGGMGEDTLRACREFGCVYFHAIGGAAQVLAESIKNVDNVYFLNEFGAPEAMWCLTVEKFPVMVTMDTKGNSIHKTIADSSSEVLQQLLNK